MNDTMQHRSAPRVIAIATAALGAAIVVGTLATSAGATAAVASISTETQSLDVAGVQELDIDAGATSLRVIFADVDEATLEVTSGEGVEAWTFERDGDELTVASPDRQWGLMWSIGRDVSATLTLPSELQGDDFDASVTLAAGELDVYGRFGDLEIDMGAGGLEVDASADSVSVQLSAGGADIRVADARSAEFIVNAGTLLGQLTGAAPSSVGVDVSAGSAELTLPAGTYDVRSDVSAGELQNGLTTAAGAANLVDISVSAGSVTLTPAR